MPAKTLKQIQDEADRLFGKKASSEKFQWRQQQQAAAGLEVERKTRGGVAGAYDRNKKLVSAGVTGLGYMLGGSGGAALARGVVQGFDRPGQSGIGFDVKRGLRGAQEGLAAGGALELAGAGLEKLGLGGGAPADGPPAPAARAADTLPGMGGGPGAGAGAGGVAGGAAGGMSAPTFSPSAASQRIGQMGAQLGGQVAGPAGQAAGQAFNWRSLLTNPQVIAGATGAVSDVMGQYSQRQVAEQQMEQQNEQFQQQFNAAEEERKRQQAQADRLANLFMPLRSRGNS